MTKFAVAGIQTSIGMGNNMAAIRRRVDLLMHLYPWVQMVVLSELAAHGPNPQSAQEAGGPLEQELCEIARTHALWLVGGSLFESREGRIYNMTPVIDPSGEVVTRYRKIFPFSPYEEATSPGSELCVFDVPRVGRFGVSICYDLWFPEITRSLTAMGAEVILNPVLAHFVDRPADLAIARGSAAMFQSYVFHINGLHSGGNGQSIVVDPSGLALYEGGVGEEFFPIEVDFELVRRQRKRGLLSMGQPLKSFRDSQMRFSVYDRENFDNSYLNSLGPLKKPGRYNAED